MIPSEAKFDFDEVIRNEAFEMDRSLAATMAATQGNLITRGLAQSSVMALSLSSDATNAIKARAQLVFGQLLRCLSAHHVTLDSSNLPEVIDILRQTIDTQSQSIRHRLLNFPIFQQSQDQAFAAIRQQVQAQYDQEAPRLINRLTAELRLAAAASRSGSQAASSGTSINISGPVGVVQTGDGSQATVTQHIDTGTKTQLNSALQLYLEELDKPEHHSIARRDELRELVLDAKAELEKPQPNSLKLGANLRAIAETSKFLGSLGPAYQVIKPFLSFFGIHLP